MRRLLLLLLTALALAACGGDGADGEEGLVTAPTDALAAAATATEAAGSYGAEIEITMEGFAPELVTMKAQGVFSRDPVLSRVTMDMSDLARGTGIVQIGEVELVMDGSVVYMRMPFLQEISPGLKPWIKFDLQELGEQRGLDFRQLMQFGTQSDPSHALAYLRAASDEVEEVGTEDVRGVETTHYRMTVELARVADAAPPEQRDDLRAQTEQLRELSGISEVPTEVWVDDEGLVRRQRLTYRNMRFAPGQEGDMTLTMELFDFGVEVDVEPPPADEVTEIGELLGGY
jgi:hypothetical protein